MTAIVERVAPGAADLVRRDHQALLTLFHRWGLQRPRRRRRALALSCALALEVHARVEEEILYTALREAGPSEFLLGAPAEHARMVTLIAQLRQMPADDPAQDGVFLTLMREVLHHMAEEETRFLPEVERVLHGRLGELGAQMMARRMALMAPRLPALAWHRLGAMRAASAWLLAGALGVGVGVAWLLAGSPQGHARPRRAA